MRRFIEAADSTEPVGTTEQRYGAHLRSLFYRIALDRTLTQKRRGSDQTFQLGLLADFDKYVSEAVIAPDTQYEERERANLLFEALGRLRTKSPEAYQLIILQLEGWSTEDIAAHLETTYGAAKERLSQARRKLRDLMVHYQRHESPTKGTATSAYSLALTLGAAFRREVSGRPGLLTHDQAAALLSGPGSHTNIDKLPSTIAISVGQGEHHYPRWQFEDGIRDYIPRILAALDLAGDTWGEYLFFTQANPNLDGRTPLEALRQSQIDAVIGAATAFSESASNG